MSWGQGQGPAVCAKLWMCRMIRVGVCVRDWVLALSQGFGAQLEPQMVMVSRLPAAHRVLRPAGPLNLTARSKATPTANPKKTQSSLPAVWLHMVAAEPELPLPLPQRFLSPGPCPVPALCE